MSVDGEARLQSGVGARILIEGRRYLNFGGSAYLGLASRPEIIEAGMGALRAYGAGSSMLRGQGLLSPAHVEFEEQAARYFGSQAAMFVPTGYLIGMILLSTLRHECDAVFFDEHAHYSLREAIVASGLKNYTFQHVDVDDLEQVLKAQLRQDERPLIVTDGLFPTMGEIAPLDELWRVASSYGGRLLVDEAHSFGVLGASGRGCVEQHGLDSSDILSGGSLAKSFSTCGAVIACNKERIDELRRTPAALGANAGAVSSVAMCAASLRYVGSHPELLQRLRENVAYMKSALRGLGLNIAENIAPVAAFGAGSPEEMRYLKERLFVKGIFVYYTSYVGASSGGVIRCGIFADHTRDDIDEFISTLGLLL